jgi:hypothetical protein
MILLPFPFRIAKDDPAFIAILIVFLFVGSLIWGIRLGTASLRVSSPFPSALYAISIDASCSLVVVGDAGIPLHFFCIDFHKLAGRW